MSETPREFHWKVTGMPAVILGLTLLAMPFAATFAAGFILGRMY